MDNLQQPLSEDDNEPESGLNSPPRSLRAAINAHCKACIYDDTLHGGLGTWRFQVESCTVTKCNLWPVRPVSKPKKKALPEAIE